MVSRGRAKTYRVPVRAVKRCRARVVARNTVGRSPRELRSRESHLLATLEIASHFRRVELY